MVYSGDMGEKIRSFTDLTAWKEAHKLALLIYELTELFPQKEIHALTNQMRRCAISISSNIAEGFSRQTKKEKIQFYYTAKGSLTELQNQLLISRDVKYITKEAFNNVAQQTVVVSRLITGLIRSIKNRA